MAVRARLCLNDRRVLSSAKGQPELYRFGGSMKQITLHLRRIFRAVVRVSGVAALASGLCSGLPALAAEGGDAAQTPVSQNGQAASIDDRALLILFKSGRFSSVLAGRYPGEAQARQAAGQLRSRGLTAFVLKKEIQTRGIFSGGSAEDFYVVLTGLFGRERDADFLGRRLKAGNHIPAYRVVSVDDPGTQEATAAQNADLYARLTEVGRQVQEKASRPLSADSPAASGQAFKNRVYGSYVGSYRDPREAQAQAEKLTAGGWPASVRREGAGASAWFRVYMVPAEDQMDWRADDRTFEAARKSAAAQPGIFFLVDMYDVRGDIVNPRPEPGRDDASACAGFSKAGRLGGSLRRTMIYIPDTSYTAALIALGEGAGKGRARIRDRVKSWWDEKPKPGRALYGPVIFNRPEMAVAIGRLRPETKPNSLAMGLTEIAGHLFAVPGRKVVVVFSEFLGEDKPEDVREVLARLRSEFGSSLEVVFVHGDTDDAGYRLAADLALRAGGPQAWDGCMLMNDNAYFEQYIKTIFR